MLKPYEACPYNDEEWGVFHKPTSNWMIFGTESAMQKRAEELNEEDEFLNSRMDPKAALAYSRLNSNFKARIKTFLRENPSHFLCSERDVIDAYLIWEGIHGFTDTVIDLVREAYAYQAD